MHQNLTNIYTITQFYQARELSSQQQLIFKMASRNIYKKSIPTIFFALIENLYVNCEKQKITTLSFDIKKNLEQLIEYKQYYDSGLCLLNVLQEISLTFEKSLQKIYQVLKNKLYRQKDNFILYLEWRFSNFNEQRFLNHVSQQFSKHFITYGSQNGLLKKRVKQYKGENIYQNPCFYNQIHLYLNQNHNQILYEFSSLQFKTIIQSSHLFYKQINTLKTQNKILESKINELQNQNQKIKIQKSVIQYWRQQLNQLNCLKQELSAKSLEIQKLGAENMKIINKLSESKKQLNKVSAKLKQTQQLRQLQTVSIQLKNEQKIEQINIVNQSQIFNQKKLLNQQQNSQIQKIKDINSNHFTDFCFTDHSKIFTQQCPICLQYQIPYSIYNCLDHHVCCNACHIQHISSALKQGETPKCPECKSQYIYDIFYNFLKQAKRQDLALQIGIRHYKNSQTLFQCKYCNGKFQIDKNTKFINHCNHTHCIICNQQHTDQSRCSQSHLLNMIQFIERPCICPTCFSLYGKDDQCEHVQCKLCKQKKLQLDGFCSICSAIRTPIKAHDNSYHRYDCKFYSAVHQNLEPNCKLCKQQKKACGEQKFQQKCDECKKLNSPCKRPTQTLINFLEKNFGDEFIKKFLQKRKAVKMDK